MLHRKHCVSACNCRRLDCCLKTGFVRWSVPAVKDASRALQDGSRNFALWPKRPRGLRDKNWSSVLNVRALRCWSDTQRGAVRIRRSLPQRAGTIKTARTLPGAAEGSQSPTTRRRRAARKHRACPTPHAVAALKHHGAAPRPADDDGRVPGRPDPRAGRSGTKTGLLARGLSKKSVEPQGR